jgi:hypothetical protein
MMIRTARSHRMMIGAEYFPKLHAGINGNPPLKSSLSTPIAKISIKRHRYCLPFYQLISIMPQSSRSLPKHVGAGSDLINYCSNP